MELARTVSNQPATAVQIASLLLGQGDQNLGQSNVLEPGDFKPRIILQTNLLDNPSAGEMITVHLRAERESNDFPEVPIATPIAELEFGMGGERTSLLLDFDSGTQITVPAGTVRVTARMPEDEIQLDSVSCGAFISRGTRAGGSCCSGPRFTRRFLSDGENATIAIPVGAKNLTPWNALLATIEIVWLDNALMPIGFFTVEQAAPFQRSPTPVPPTARSLAASGQNPLTLVFGLEG